MRRRKNLLAVLGAALALTVCTGNIAWAADTKEGSEKESEAVQETAQEAMQETAQAAVQGTEQENGLLQTAESFAEDLVNGDYEKLKTEYSYADEIKQLIESGQLEQALAPVIKASGELKEIGAAWVSESALQSVNVQVPIDFSIQPWNLSLSFNAEGKMIGVFTAPYQENVVPIPEGVVETDRNLKIANGRELPGTWTQPEGKEEYAAVIFVHGSGTSDRNETAGHIKPFQDLAWGLAQRGIASYRYDKISYVYGQEIAEDKNFTVYDETVNDAVAAIEMVRGLEGVTKVYVVGHSQGGQMMPAIAEAGSPDGCIMMAAPTEKFADLLRDQLEFLEGLDPKEDETEKAYYEEMYKELDKMDGLDTMGEDEKIMGLYTNYLKSIVDYDPAAEAEDMEMPVLVLQGEEDYQVPMDNFKVWQETYGEKENWQFQSFPGLTHMFTEGKLENGPADYQGEKHIPEEVIDRIAEFIGQ